MRAGWLNVETWAGRYHTIVELIGETPKRYRIRALQRTRLAGRDRWLDAGGTALVPKSAVDMIHERSSVAGR